jgi:phosphoenolpyruvate-protein kinase (PTS system EI component)
MAGSSDVLVDAQGATAPREFDLHGRPMTSEPAPYEGSPAVDGIAIGRASIWGSDPEPRSETGTVNQERHRLVRAHQRSTRGVEDLVRLLPPSEAELFLPEIAILAELGPLMLARVDAGASAEDAVREATAQVSTDLLLDARARLLDALGHDYRSVQSLLEGRTGDRVLVTDSLTPSVVASLPPQIVGIVAASAGEVHAGVEGTSHAVVIARGRAIPLAFLPGHIVKTIADDDPVILDTTGSVSWLWVAPTEGVVVDARRRHARWVVGRAEEDAQVARSPLAHLGLEMRVSLSSIYERVPPSAEGIGLVRTEVLFSDHAAAPSEFEQLATLRSIAANAGNPTVVARLFDAGGDKPLAWLPVPADAPLTRGIALLFMHPDVLGAQLRAIVRAAEHVAVRILLPMVTCAGDVERIRRLSEGKVAVGAMVETPAAVEQIDDIAAASDFLCIGMNDLSASVTGQDRARSSLSFDARVLRMVEHVVARAHARGRRITACGELAADSRGARILAGLGVDGICVSIARFAKVKLSLRDATIEECRQIARAATDP